ncbi:ribosome biogenesis GTP-binding protein YihA/YsxC [Mechercharimyces sp. CAU 1602]|uniref:ribosome biogenesis GTP-binding protein YihA/YsxC n=1 Tax=Mechercharimyces sp. CAU 1602 TaxID=2973933 RepID=UPI00216249DE|nr:ribosome biogenesis GTP-binding protein YihA/YsxC [Mechercharimyces sp. CAU 1602]MCS1351470.1 ribosome biogenesis GTP-binding protein YihA/YsxC [Mechercharimyces sp. CAU 1602]
MSKVKAEFIISAVGPDQYPDDALPEIALAGRSNVGKSSLINRLIHRKNLARTSSRPGKTQTINFYLIEEQIQFYFADMPGYGFAKVSKSIRAQWGKMVERYLHERQECQAVIQLIDVRHPPTRDDKQMYEWLKHYEKPTIVVATKADKISRNHRQKHLKVIRQELDIAAGDELILFSAETGEGKDQLWHAIKEKAVK